VQIGVGVFRHVVVEDDVDALDVHAATEQIGCHQDALLKVLELLVATESARTFRPTTIITARVMLTFQCRQDRRNGLVGLCCKPQPLVINRRLTGVSVKTEDAFVSAILSGHYIVDCWACCVRWSLNYYLDHLKNVLMLFNAILTFTTSNAHTRLKMIKLYPHHTLPPVCVETEATSSPSTQKHTYNTLVFTASFHDNLVKPVLECQTVLWFLL